MTSIFSIHGARNVEISNEGYPYADADNAVGIRIVGRGDNAEIKIFGLPANIAQALCDAIRALPKPETTEGWGGAPINDDAEVAF